MLITSISYQDKKTGWTLQELPLGRFNLLVGASGVGKTQILRALRKVQSFASKKHSTHPVAFTVGFQHQNIEYVWKYESASIENDRDVSLKSDGFALPLITHEKFISSLDGVLIDRNQDRFLFKGKELPQLNRLETALTLFDEESITTAANALSHFILNDYPHNGVALLNERTRSVLNVEMTKDSEIWQRISWMPTQAKAFILQEKQPEKFRLLKENFKSIFTSVEDVAVELDPYQRAGSRLNERRIQFKLKEHGNWVFAESISSGMLRTLNHLVDLTLAPSGSVILIDEFENSLGVNCLGPLTDFLLSRAADLQFIITSHHPYIINKIPKSYWKVVRRHGSTVKVTPAGEVRALQGASTQDDFTRLINSPEFEEGVT